VDIVTQDNLLKKYLSFPINRAGWPYIAVAVVVALFLGKIWGFLGTLAWLATAWTVWFFRDPARVTPVRAGLVVGAADGVVRAIDQAVPPAELGLGTQALPRVSVERGLFAVQVNRVPVDGSVTKAVVTEGTFELLSKPDAETQNKRAAVVVTRADGTSVAVVQIAGTFARAVTADLAQGGAVLAGQRYGLPKFSIEPLKPFLDKLVRRAKGEKVEWPKCGDCKPSCKLTQEGLKEIPAHLISRIDLYLPAGAVPQVAVGQKIIGGETVVADLSSTESARPFETR